MQHQRIAGLGGPSSSNDSQKRFPALALNRFRLYSFVTHSTFLTVSGNSSPVSTNKRSNSLFNSLSLSASSTSRSVARLSFPPEYETVIGRSTLATTPLMNSRARSTYLSSTSRLATTAELHSCSSSGRFSRGMPCHLVLTATPFVAVIISSPLIRARPHATTRPSGVSTTTSESTMISRSASITPGARTFAPRSTNPTAPSSILTHPFLLERSVSLLKILAAPSSRGRNLHRFSGTSKRSAPITAPSRITSSIRSS